METIAFLAFGLGFFLFSSYICIHDNRRSESRMDYRNDLEYHRMLNERREFGYKTNDEHIRPIRYGFFGRKD